jgi:hypothetical protein
LRNQKKLDKMKVVWPLERNTTFGSEGDPHHSSFWPTRIAYQATRQMIGQVEDGGQSAGSIKPC